MEIVRHKTSASMIATLLRLRRILLQGLPHHVVQLAFDLASVALVLAGDAAPNQGTGSRVAQIDDQGTLRIWHPHDARAPTAPPGRVGLNLRSAGRSEPVSHVEVRRPGDHR